MAVAPNLGNTFAEQIARGLKELDPEQIRGVIIPLYATLLSTTTTGYDTYRVPTTHDLLIEEIRPHLLALDISTELYATIDANLHMGPTMEDRLILKASNCKVDLKNSDREQKVIENHSLVLVSLMKPVGDSLKFGTTPHKVPAGETLRLDVALQDSDHTLTGVASTGSTQYGLVLVGKLVRVARS